MTELRVGTRGSLLATTQTSLVIKALHTLRPDIVLEQVVIRTSGDRGRREARGAFVREIQEALLRGEVDLAVHSLKDLPVEPVHGLSLAAHPERADPRDALITRGPTFAEIAHGAVIGTGSLRRTAQMRRLRPDLAFAPLVGNVDTRLDRLVAGEFDGIVVAAAALERLGHGAAVDAGQLDLRGASLAVRPFALEEMLPAPGQGTLAIECRDDRSDVRELLALIDSPTDRLAVAAERALLAAMGGGCRTPLGAHADVTGAHCRLLGFAASEDALRSARADASGPADRPEELAAAVADRLRALLAGAP